MKYKRTNNTCLPERGLKTSPIFCKSSEPKLKRDVAPDADVFPCASGDVSYDEPTKFASKNTIYLDLTKCMKLKTFKVHYKRHTPVVDSYQNLALKHFYWALTFYYRQMTIH